MKYIFCHVSISLVVSLIYDLWQEEKVNYIVNLDVLLLWTE